MRPRGKSSLPRVGILGAVAGSHFVDLASAVVRQEGARQTFRAQTALFIPPQVPCREIRTRYPQVPGDPPNVLREENRRSGLAAIGAFDAVDDCKSFVVMLPGGLIHLSFALPFQTAEELEIAIIVAFRVGFPVGDDRLHVHGFGLRQP
jgi:hypothetical protein